jgi:hypothetical protein
VVLKIFFRQIVPNPLADLIERAGPIGGARETRIEVLSLNEREYFVQNLVALRLT